MEIFQLTAGTKDCPIPTLASVLHNDPDIQDNWSQFARGLGIPNGRIKKFRQDVLLDKIIVSDIIVEVLDLWVSNNGHDATVGKLLQVVEGECEAVTVGESLRLKLNLPCKASAKNGSIEWNELSPAFQNRVADNFRQFFPTNEQFTKILPALKGLALINLMRGIKPIFYNQPLPETLTYYIQRLLITRDVICGDIFEMNFPDIFLFKGMDRLELSGRAKANRSSSSREQLRGLEINARFIVLNQANHFDKICGKTSQPVHLLSKETRGGRLKWIKSRGSMSNLQRCIDKEQDILQEDHFLEYLHSVKLPVCITDSPGMGKSVLLAQIGSRLSKMYPNRVVLFVVISEFLKLFKEVDIEDKIRATGEVLKNMLGNNIQWSKMDLEEEEAISIELLLDAFDEVDSVDHQDTYEIFGTIARNFKSIRMWITSRPHLLDELETNLNVLGFNIRPFCEEDQVQFLSSFWSKNTSLDQAKTKEYARNCLKALRSKMSSTDHDIAGIPLQCLLIGEAYEADAVEYARLDNDLLATALEVETGTITDLYRLLVKRKIEKWRSLSLHGPDNGKIIGILNEKRILDIHIRLSLELIFPGYVEIFGLPTDPITPDVMEQVLRIGILESSAANQCPRFLHRTFAEYFLALYITDQLSMDEEWSEGLTNLFFQVLECHITKLPDYQSVGVHNQSAQEFTFSFSYPVISYFLNSLISTPKTISDGDFQNKFKSLEWIRKAVHASCNDNYVRLFKFFFEFIEYNEHASRIFDVEIVYLSVWNSSLELFEDVLSQFERHHDYWPVLTKLLLRMAVRRGRFSIVEFLIKERHPYLVESFGESITELLHDCVENSKINQDSEIEQKILIVRMLLKICPSLLEIKGGIWKATPLLSYGVHIQLLVELVEQGANVLAQELGGSTVLHINQNRNHLSSKDYHKLVQSIPEEKLKSLVKIKGNDKDTPLMSLLRWNDPEPETLVTFKGLGADFKLSDANGDSVLKIAIKNGRIEDTLRLITDCGGNISNNSMRSLLNRASCSTLLKKKRTGGNKSLLHYAAEGGNVEAVWVLLEEKRLNVDVLDGNGLTPLDYAIRGSKDDERRFKAGRLLHLVGGTFREDVNSEGRSLLHTAVIQGNIQSIRLLITLGVDINDVDAEGNSALHLGVQHEDPIPLEHTFSIVRRLLENKANPNRPNMKGKTPLYLALKNKHLDLATFRLLKSKTEVTWSTDFAVFVKSQVIPEVDVLDDKLFLLTKEFWERGVDINYQNDQGESLLHAVAERGYASLVRYLVSKDADVNLKNLKGQTPLHAAALLGDKELGLLLEMIQYLVENDADVYAKDNDELTFLYRYILDAPSAVDFHFMVAYLVKRNLASLFDIPNGEFQATSLQLAVLNLEPEVKTLGLLSSNNVNFNAVNKDGDSVLKYAIQGKKSRQFLAILVKKFHADWKVLNNHQNSLLHGAAQNGNLDALKYFLDLDGLDVNGIDMDGDTPLHCAAQQEGEESLFEKCRLLMEKGADVSLPNNQGRTPLEILLDKHEGMDNVELLRLFQR